MSDHDNHRMQSVLWDYLKTTLDDELDDQALNLRFLDDFNILKGIRGMRAHNSVRSSFVLGVSAHQGAGKSRFLALITYVFEKAFGERVVGFSIDDFYYPHEELTHRRELISKDLSSMIPGVSQDESIMYQYRGNAGTHDDALLSQTVDQLLDNISLMGWYWTSVKIPQYDKYQHMGRGDRCPLVDWITVQTKPDWIVIDGWNLKHQAMPSETLQSRIERFSQRSTVDRGNESESFNPKYNERNLNIIREEAFIVNRYLSAPERLHWIRRLNGLLIMEPVEDSTTIQWRRQAEESAIKAGRQGLSPDRISLFMQCYIPSYVIWGRNKHLKVDLLKGLPTIRVILNPDRSSLEVKNLF